VWSDEEIVDPVIEAAWLEEAKRRLESVRTGRMQTKPMGEVERKLWAMLERSPIGEQSV
jgi:hypothetical protein